MSSDHSSLFHQHLQLNHRDRNRNRVLSKDCSIESACPSFSSSSQTGSNSTDDRSSHPVAVAEDLSLSSSEGNDPAYSVIGSSDTQSSTRPSGNRRRSHRPRGCRGGRKNRKKQLGKELALSVPKEILGTKSVANQQPSKPFAMVFNSGGMYIPNPKDTLVVNQDAFRSSFPDENKAGWHPTSAVGSTGYSMNSCNGLTSGIYNSQPSRDYTFQPHSQQHVSGRHFSAPKSSTFNVPSNGPPKPVFGGIQEILPPPPIAARDSPPPFDGPNPYALTTAPSLSIDNLDRTRDLSAVPSQSKNRAEFAAPQHALGFATTAPSSVPSAVALARLVTAGSDASDGADAASASSSSLFATSPRTFLLGGGACGEGAGHPTIQW
jgi:hypothetical protein